MRDYWMTQELLRLVGWGYIAICVAALVAAVWFPRRWWGKAMAAACVLGLASILPMKAKRLADEEQVKVNEYKQRYTKAKALFDERCKTAGEKIYRTVEGVEGILLMKVRPERINFGDQYAMDDPYGRDVGGEGYIRSFLRVSEGASKNLADSSKRDAGYKWILAKNPVDGVLYRYVGVIKVEGGSFDSEKRAVSGESAQFGADYSDISLKEDRDNWIAGGVLKVMDLRSNEVLAQRRGYIFDPGLGSTSGGRGPWEAAIACPGADRNYGHNARFVQKVLISNPEKK